MESFGIYKQLARNITLVENELPGYLDILENLTPSSTPVIGITGAPGAGKSSLANALVNHYLQNGKRIAIIAIDPSSPFNFGSLLGDRVRLSNHFNNPNVFIRSLASRGSLGGLCEKIVELVDVVKGAHGSKGESLFDIILLETVGVGQSEVEIAGLADMTVVTFTPASGDEVQSMKAGLMEIADLFVVNKADLPQAESFAKNLAALVHERFGGKWEPPVVKTIATEQKGIEELALAIGSYFDSGFKNEKKKILLAEKAWRLIQAAKMKTIDRNQLEENLQHEMANPKFNLFKFVKNYLP